MPGWGDGGVAPFLVRLRSVSVLLALEGRTCQCTNVQSNYLCVLLVKTKLQIKKSFHLSITE